MSAVYGYTNVENASRFGVGGMIGKLYSWKRSDSALISYWKVEKQENGYVWVRNMNHPETDLVPVPELYFNSWFKEVKVTVRVTGKEVK